jgi:hypothetical protein
MGPSCVGVRLSGITLLILLAHRLVRWAHNLLGFNNRCGLSTLSTSTQSMQQLEAR